LIALAVAVAMLAVVLYVLGSRWLDLQERELTGDDPKRTPRRALPDPDADDAGLVETIKRGPEEQLAAERDAWWEEKRDEGYSDAEIRKMLDEREAHLFI
jgi:hypothetical protein